MMDFNELISQANCFLIPPKENLFEQVNDKIFCRNNDHLISPWKYSEIQLRLRARDLLMAGFAVAPSPSFIAGG